MAGMYVMSSATAAAGLRAPPAAPLQGVLAFPAPQAALPPSPAPPTADLTALIASMPPAILQAGPKMATGSGSGTPLATSKQPTIT